MLCAAIRRSRPKAALRWRRYPSSLPDYLHWQTRLALEDNGFALPEGLRQIYDLISTPDFMAESCMPPVAFRANSAQTLSFPSLRIQLFAARRNPASFVVFCMDDMPAADPHLCHCRNRQFATVGRPGRLAPSKGRASSSAPRRISIDSPLLSQRAVKCGMQIEAILPQSR